MSHETVPVLETRRAAKVILQTGNQEMVFVAGKRGMLNLPGGGIDMISTASGVREEDAETALFRELHEELGLNPHQISEPMEICGTWDTVTPELGPARRAIWSVYTADLHVPAQKLEVPSGSEITAIKIMTAQECLKHSNMSKLAQHAVRHILHQNWYV